MCNDVGPQNAYNFSRLVHKLSNWPAAFTKANIVLRMRIMARAEGPTVVCVINLKGGVGKSTISALLARRGYSTHDLDVLAIDLDPQANLSQGLMHSDYSEFLKEQRPSIVELFSGYVPPTAKVSTPKPLLPNLHLRSSRRPGRGPFSLYRHGSTFRTTCWELCGPTLKRLLDI
jgi:hypothetical protein